MMAELFKLLKRDIYPQHYGGLGIIPKFILRNIDLLVAPWLLDVSILYIYVCARAMSSIVPAAVTCLGVKVRPQLLMLAHADEQLHFKAAAARVNLGYMMICGAFSLFTLAIGIQMTHSFEEGADNFRNILLWAVAGQSAPVLFGATNLLMHVRDRSVVCDLLLGFTTVLFLGATALIAEQEASVLVQNWAFVQLTHAGICALLLTQCGVWPGLTAIFHKEIRLF